MMVEIVVDVTSTNNADQIANILIRMEAGCGQLALKHQLVQQLFNCRINATQDCIVMSM